MENTDIYKVDLPKLIINKKIYTKYNIPCILKQIFKIDEINNEKYPLIEKEKFEIEKETLENILLDWAEIEFTVFNDLEKFLFTFNNYYYISRTNFLFNFFNQIIYYLYNPWNNIKKIFVKVKNVDNFSSAFNITNHQDCMTNILNIIQKIENFLALKKERIKVHLENNKYFEFSIKKVFSYDLVIYSIYEIFKDLFNTEKDLKYLNQSLRIAYKDEIESYDNKKKDFENEDNKDYLIQRKLLKDVNFILSKIFLF